MPLYCISCNKTGSCICDNCILLLRKTRTQNENEILSCFDYQNEIIKKLIWNLKYNKQFIIGEKLGKILYEELLEEISDLEIYTKGKKIIVVAVPLFKKRQKERGYNQSEIIAENFTKMNSEIFEFRNDLIIKNINTIQQAKLQNRIERLKNIKNAFSATRPEIIKNRTIIVIDDVTTTGGTLLEIKKILEKSGAKKVLCIALAH
jgi:ComF family protein